MTLKSKTFLNHKDLVDFVNKNIFRNNIQEIIRDENYYILFYWERESETITVSDYIKPKYFYVSESNE